MYDLPKGLSPSIFMIPGLTTNSSLCLKTTIWTPWRNTSIGNISRQWLIRFVVKARPALGKSWKSLWLPCCQCIFMTMHACMLTFSNLLDAIIDFLKRLGWKEVNSQLKNDSLVCIIEYLASLLIQDLVGVAAICAWYLLDYQRRSQLSKRSSNHQFAVLTFPPPSL